MPTAKKRINITVNDEIYETLDALSIRENESVSHISLELLERALELKEDLYFSKIADKRLETKQRRYSHKHVWK